MSHARSVAPPLALFVATPLLCGLFVGAPALLQPSPAWAQQSSNDAEEWFDDLLLEGGDKGDLAAYELFMRQVQPERLRQIMAGENTKAQLCILRALKWAGRAHPRVAFSLVSVALGDPSEKIDDAATRALGFLEDPWVYEETGRQLAKLRYARPETTDGRKARGLVAGIARLRYPMRATGVLVRALGERMEPSLERHVRQTLELMTAQRFSSPAQWQAWWKKVQERELTPSEWAHEVVKRRSEAQREIERTAEEFYERLLAALADKPQQLLRELERGLGQEKIPDVQQRAIYELGRLGRLPEDGKTTPERAQALKLLVTRLKTGQNLEFDPLTAEVIKALGQTGDASLLAELTHFLHHDSPRMRMAAVQALAELGSPQAVKPLLTQLDHEDPKVVKATIWALGKIGADPVLSEGPPPLRVSDKLATYCRQILAANGQAPASSVDLLAAAARALGSLRRDEPTPAVIELLAALVDHKDGNVRFETASALGPLASERGFRVLLQRVDLEPEINVRRAILGSLGRQARASVAHVPSAVHTLVPFLFNTREELQPLRQESQYALVPLAKQPDLVGLSAILDAIEGHGGDPATLEPVARSFLGFLPEFDADDLGRLSEPVRRRYYALLARRAAVRLRDEPAKALADYSDVLSGRGWHTVDAIDDASLPIFLGKAKALLTIPAKRPKEAFGIAEACLDHKATAETWGVSLDALDVLKQTTPAELPPLLERLGKRIGSAPEAVRQRYEALRRPSKPSQSKAPSGTSGEGA